MPSQSPGDYPGISAEEADAKCQALPMGTYQRMRWEAVRNALEPVTPWAAKEPRPEVARWFWLLTEAFTSAVDLVKQTRRAEPEPTYILGRGHSRGRMVKQTQKAEPVSGEEYAGVAARFEGLWPLAKAERIGLDLTGWPNNPDAVLACWAEQNWETAAWRLASVIDSALNYVAGDRHWEPRLADEWLVSDPWFEGFRDGFAAEVERLFPRAEVWGSMIVLNREARSALHQLEAEYRAWAEAQLEVAGTTVSKREPAEGTDGMQPGPDFMTFAWGDEVFEFNRPMQRAAIRHLWAAWESGHPRIQVERLRELVGSSDTAKPSDWFRGHPAWGKLIVTPRQGVYELQSPASAK